MNETNAIRLLCVEANPVLLQNILPVLNGLGYLIDVVETGQAGTEKIQDGPFDLVIINQNLPDMPGISCLRDMLELQSDLAFIMLLAEDQIELVPELLILETTSYLIIDDKKLFVAQISSIISNLLARQRLLLKLRKTEQSLERQTENMKAIFDYAPVEIYLKGTDRGYQWVNKQWQLHYNKTNEAAIGLTSHDIIPAKTANISKSNDLKVLETGMPTEESQVVETSLGTRTLRTLRFPVKNSTGAVTGIGVVALDDTEKRQSEAVLRSIFEDASVGIVLHAPDGNTRVRVNDAFCQYVGHSREELLRDTYDLLTHPDDLETSLALRRELYVGKRDTISFEKRYLHKEGHTVWGAVSSYVIRGDDNKVLHFVSYIQDITERKNTEKELVLLSKAVEAATDALVIVDARAPDMPIISVNSAFLHMTGYSEAECLGQNCRFLQQYDDQLELQEELQHAFKETHSVQVTLKNFKKSGDLFWNDLRVAPIKSEQGEVTHFVASMRDVTDIRNSQENLEAWRQRLSLATQGVGIGVWDWDITNNHLFWDQRNCELYGVPYNEFGENYGSWSNSVHPDDFSTASAELQDALDGHKEYDTQFRIIRPDAEIRILRGKSIVSRDTTGAPTRVVGINWDITEQIAMEEKLRRSQKMDAVGQLTGGIAHDFNNILGIVMGSLELIEDQISDNPEILKLVKPAIYGVERGSNITKKLLSFSGKKSSGTFVVQINDIIRNMRDLITTSLTVSVSVKLDLADNLWPTDINPGDLEDAILNLSLNARDAMPEGGSLLISTANKIVDKNFTQIPLSERSGEFTCISVTDSGTGMTDEVKEKLFDPFFTTKNPGKGTGLGLSMVFGFVQRSGGYITHHSAPGSGTSFHLYLPKAAENKMHTELGDLESMTLPRGTETILIVDDEKALADVAATHLRGLGYTTYTATNGRKALQILREHFPIDLMFSDVVMPGDYDGYQLALEAKTINPDLNILLTSGFTNRPESLIKQHQGLIEELASHILEKPYNRREIARAVRQCLDRAS